MNDTELARDTLDQLRGVSTATLTMQLLKRGLRNCFIKGPRPLDPGNCRFVAEAYTLRFLPMREDLSTPEVLGDPNYAPRKAVEDIPPGQAMLIDCRGEQGAGSIGDILALRMRKRGVAAVVSDGPVRDAVAVVETGLPVFCTGSVAPASLTVHYGADLQLPVACGGVTVFPGDVLAGDSDGVVVIPRALAAEIAPNAVEQERLEGFLKSRVADGRPTIGTYPPNEETRAAYDAWCKTQDG
jgi:regulator of RNase E activity RraA